MHTHETLSLTTPHGHEVVVEVDYQNFALRAAQVVNAHTGVITPLDDAIAQNLARAIQARSVYAHALSETRAVEQTLNRFGEVAMALGNRHPALEPYWAEAAQHEAIARDMGHQAQLFQNEAMRAIDRMVEE